MSGGAAAAEALLAMSSEDEDISSKLKMRIDELECELKKMTDAYASIQNDFEKGRIAYDSLQNDYGKSQSQLESLQHALEESRAELASLHNSLEVSRAQIDSLRDDWRRSLLEKKNKIADLEAQLASIRDEFKRTLLENKTRIEDLEGQISKLEALIEELQSANSSVLNEPIIETRWHEDLDLLYKLLDDIVNPPNQFDLTGSYQAGNVYLSFLAIFLKKMSIPNPPKFPAQYVTEMFLSMDLWLRTQTIRVDREKMQKWLPNHNRQTIMLRLHPDKVTPVSSGSSSLSKALRTLIWYMRNELIKGLT
jgi:uncharacterized phage infection (PIP) family protein YhgE